MAGVVGALRAQAVIALVAAVGAYFGSYLREKGKNLATHEDIDRVVRATEDVKAEISGELWERQNRWTFKRDIYVRLLENLRVAFLSGKRLVEVQQMEPAEQARHQQWTDALLDEQQSAMAQVLRAAAVATIFVGDDARHALRELEDAAARSHAEPTVADFSSRQFSAISAAYEALSAAAKADLVL